MNPSHRCGMRVRMTCQIALTGRLTAKLANGKNGAVRHEYAVNQYTTQTPSLPFCLHGGCFFHYKHNRLLLELTLAKLVHLPIRGNFFVWIHSKIAPDI